MKYMFRFFIALSCTIVISNSYAANGWQADTRINNLVIEPGNGFSINTQLGSTDCPQNGKFHVPWDAPRAKEIYATALAAKISNSIIQMHADWQLGCPFGGVGSNAIVIK